MQPIMVQHHVDISGLPALLQTGSLIECSDIVCMLKA